MDQLGFDLPATSSSGALISDCGTWRYNLWRRWSDGPLLGFVMMNPSTADASLDDQTIRQCCYFANREGNGGIYVVNLFAYRATQQADLWAQVPAIAIGLDNDQHITAAIWNDRISGFVAAWGVLPKAARYRAGIVHAMFADGGRPLSCFGLTKDGSPRHPARLPHSATIGPFRALR